MRETPSLIPEIEDAIASGSVNQRLRALKRITDLFLASSDRYSREQIALFDDVLTRLASTIEVEARAVLAGRLARAAGAPPKLIRSLAFDDAIEVAGPVLTEGQLAEPDLVANASTKSQAHLYAISRRLSLSEAVTDVLVDRGDRRVVRSVTRNAGARFSDAGFGKLVTRASDDETLAENLGMRADFPRHHFLKLLHSASASVRRKLMAAHPSAEIEAQEAVARVADTISDGVREASKAFAKAKAATKRRYSTGQLSERDIHAAAKAQRFEQAVAGLSLLGHLPVDLVERGLLDPCPDIVLILSKAAGCSRSTTKALLLMDVANRKMSPYDIDRALTSFEHLSVATAHRVIKYYVKRNDRQTDEPQLPRLMPRLAAVG
jgi:uncharacterized protein (DUF2336 family)